MSIHPSETDESSSTVEAEPNDQDELPEPEFVSNSQTTVPNLKGEATERARAIRIRLPRDETKRDKLPEDIHGVLVWVLSDVCENANIETVEVLMYPGRYGFEYVLTPRVKNIDGRSDSQSTLDEFPDELYRSGIAKLKKAVKRRYPDTITAEIGTLRLGPVGTTDVTTSRLYLKEDSTPLHSGVSKQKPLEELFDSLRHGHDPFIYQVIAEKSESKFNIVVRLATYHPKDNYTGDRGFAKLVNEGKPTDPARTFANSNVVSNHDAEMAHKYWDTTYERGIDGAEDHSVHYDYSTVTQYTTRAAVRKKAELVREIILGKEEHRRLMNADTTGDVICKDEFSRYPRISLFESQLNPFVRTYTKRWETNPWKAIPGRKAPRFNSIEPIEVETPADFGVGEGLEDAPSDAKGVQNEGSAHHGSLEKFSERVFTEGGDEISKVTQNTETLPDLRITTDDGVIQTLGLRVESDTVEVECESENVTKASNTLVNAERAYAADRHVIFVYEQTDVERGYEHLKQPHKGKLDDGLKLYTQTDNVSSIDGRTLVRQGLSKTTWILKGRTLIAKDGDEVMATGPATDDVATFDWDCHYYRKDGESYRVETAEGDLVEAYGSKEAFKADWTRISQPHIPVAPSYLHFVTVAYRDEETGQLKMYDPRPDWESNDETASQKAGYEQFFQDHIVERDGPELTYDELEEVFAAWFAGHSQYDPPIRSVIGGWHPDEFKEAKTGATGNAYQYFDGFDWRMAPGIDSPHGQGPPADFDPEETPAQDEETSEPADET